MRRCSFLASLSILLLILFVGCSSDDEEATPVQIPTSATPAMYTDVSPAEAKDLIDTVANLVVLDVSPLYTQGHLPEAINHPMFDGSLAAVIPSLNKNVPYLVYCHSDSVSIAAVELLIDNGFETVYRLDGNYAAWVDAGFAVETGTGPKTTGQWMPDGLVTEYANSSQLDNDYELYWDIDDQYIYVGMKAKTDGWVAIGFEPSSKMKNADMVFGFVEDGQVRVVDMYSTGNFGPHPEDTEKGGTNDILEFGGSEDNDYTVIEFKRNLVTGDEYDNDLTGGTVKVIWAYGSSDDSSQRHSKRGGGEITLLKM
ncbi:MAG: hypothetical protein HOC20_13180 [Chloroflexi bacterium]|jgi:rhodanese-related sulfurtransferase|nr:hypothetical protein [Chloroflexota bacterium]